MIRKLKIYWMILRTKTGRRLLFDVFKELAKLQKDKLS